jgi:hypothetical protein
MAAAELSRVESGEAMKYRWQRHGTFAKGARAGLSVSAGTNKLDLKIEFVF